MAPERIEITKCIVETIQVFINQVIEGVSHVFCTERACERIFYKIMQPQP